jgi:phosphatidate cytidylyltransferase
MLTELQKRIFTSILLLLILTLMYFYHYILISFLIILVPLGWLEFNILIYKILHEQKLINKIYKIAFSFFGLTYLSFFSILIFIGFTTEELKIVFLYLLGVCILTDIGGFIFGKIFKGKKLTKISPNKTISGCLGSFILSFLFMFVFIYMVDGLNIFSIFVITFCISAFSQLGDLFISYLKRRAKVKNTSNLLPGHGGILDRLDGIFFAIPLGFFLNSFFNLI